MEFDYKNDFFDPAFAKFVYQNDDMSINVNRSTESPEKLDMRFLHEAMNHLLEILNPPLTRRNKQQSDDAYHYLLKLNEIIDKYPHQIKEIVEEIEKIMYATRSKYFFNLINEYFYSDLSPFVLNQLLSLIYTIQRNFPPQYFYPLFTDNFISDLSKIMISAKSPHLEIFPDLYDTFPNANPDFEFSEFFGDGYDDDDGSIVLIENKHMKEVEKPEKSSIMNYSAAILCNFLNNYFQLNEQEREKIQLPDFSEFLENILKAVEESSKTGAELESSRAVLILLYNVINNFESSINEIDRKLFYDIWITLINCLSKDRLPGAKVAYSCVMLMHSKFFNENPYMNDDFAKIFGVISSPFYDLHYETLGFIHSFFFSNNEEALVKLMNFLNFDIMLAISKSPELAIRIRFCHFCQDLLHLTFLTYCKYPNISDRDFISYFDGRLGLVRILSLMIQDEEFALRREAIFTLSSTCYKYDNELMRKLIVSCNFIENLFLFVSADFDMFLAALIAIHRILSIVQSLPDTDAFLVFGKLMDPDIFDEVQRAFEQFEINIEQKKIMIELNAKKIDINKVVKNYVEEEEEEEENEDNKIDPRKKKILLICDQFSRLIGIKNEQINRFKHND